MTSPGTRDRLVQRLRDHGIADERVLKAITQVPRHEFVDEALSSRAYEDTALPIGLGQTISQPWIVAKMTEALLDGGTPAKVLEVGTGSGYQAATVPDGLLEQLRVGGVLVLPLESGGMQRLLAIRRTEDGSETTDLGGVIFVPMLSGLE